MGNDPEFALVEAASKLVEAARQLVLAASGVTQSHKNHLDYLGYVERLGDLAGDLEGVVDGHVDGEQG